MTRRDDGGHRLGEHRRLVARAERQPEAEPLMRQALKIMEHHYPSDHPHFAKALNNLAAVLQDLDRSAEAEPLMRQSREIYIQSLGSEHPDSQNASANYLAVLQSLGKSPAEIQALMAPPAT